MDDESRQNRGHDVCSGGVLPRGCVRAKELHEHDEPADNVPVVSIPRVHSYARLSAGYVLQSNW